MRPRWQLLLTLAGFVAWVAVVVSAWAAGAPLGHDESQYAIAATDTLNGEESRWFYLSRGMNAVAVPGVLLGGSEHALRFVPMLIGIAFGVATWLVAWRSVGAAAGGVALLVLAASRKIAMYSSDLLSDFPAAACMVAAVAVIVDEVERTNDGVRWRIVLIAPLLAAAFYLRYGSAVPIAVIIVASIAVGARAMLRRPLPVIATAALFLVLLVPHFLLAQRLMGSPLGILLASRGVPQQEYLAEGLVTYLTSNPFRYYGLLVPFALAAGLVAVSLRDKRRQLVWLIAVGALVAVGLTTHAQVRYIMMSLALLTVVGVDRLWRWVTAATSSGAIRTGIAAIAVGLCVITWVLVVKKHVGSYDNRAKRMRGTLYAAEAIRADSGGTTCLAIGYHSTQLEWYSRCRVPLVMEPAAATAAFQRGERVYIVRDYLPTWVPAPQPVFEEYPGTRTMILQRPNEVDVARFTPPGS